MYLIPHDSRETPACLSALPLPFNLSLSVRASVRWLVNVLGKRCLL
jgi:hypothetical protein